MSYGMVYVMQKGNEDLCKIGYSAGARSREKSIRRETGWSEVRLLETFYFDDERHARTVEAEAHKRLAEHLYTSHDVGREWFSVNPARATRTVMEIMSMPEQGFIQLIDLEAKTQEWSDQIGKMTQGIPDVGELISTYHGELATQLANRIEDIARQNDADYEHDINIVKNSVLNLLQQVLHFIGYETWDEAERIIQITLAQLVDSKDIMRCLANDSRISTERFKAIARMIISDQVRDEQLMYEFTRWLHKTSTGYRFLPPGVVGNIVKMILRDSKLLGNRQHLLHHEIIQIRQHTTYEVELWHAEPTHEKPLGIKRFTSDDLMQAVVMMLDYLEKRENGDPE